MMTLDYFDLTGKVALVSGGATGLGLGISEGLAEAGATVVICSRRLNVCEESARALNDKTGSKIVAKRCDIVSATQIDTLVREVVSELGGINILVNCAGISGSEKPIVRQEEAEWDHVFDINLKGTYTLSRAVASSMIDQKQGGRIINVASIGGMIAIPNMSAYCTSKAGLVQLTKVMSLEWVRYNINVNAILPGYFSTPMNTEFFSSDAGKNVIKQNIPMRRLGQIKEIKGLAILLASEASSFMSGSAIVIDGGHTVW